MRAAIYTRIGDAREVLSIENVEVDEPSAGEVLVRVAWSGVNPSDVKTRGGYIPSTLPFPRIPHSDGSGVIENVGAGVDSRRIGQKVWLWNAAWGRPHGTAAEWVTLPASQAVPIPPNLEMDAAACLGIPATTAYHAVALNGGVSKQTVMVAGGAGAVGHYAIQIAKLEGAERVIATVSNSAKAALAKSAGADLVINYKSENVRDQVMDFTQGQGVDRIIEVDIGVNVALDMSVLRKGGTIAAYGSAVREVIVPFSQAIMQHLALQFFIVYSLSAEDRERTLFGLNRLLATGSLQHNIATRLPLEQIALAHEQIERGDLLGNVVLSVA